MADEPKKPEEQERARRAEQARIGGFTGDMCPECGNFMMVQNGACLKCTACGATTGCS